MADIPDSLFSSIDIGSLGIIRDEAADLEPLIPQIFASP